MENIGANFIKTLHKASLDKLEIKRVQVSSNQGPHPFPGGHNREIAKNWHIEIFFSRPCTRPISNGRQSSFTRVENSNFYPICLYDSSFAQGYVFLRWARWPIGLFSLKLLYIINKNSSLKIKVADQFVPDCKTHESLGRYMGVALWGYMYFLCIKSIGYF